MKKKILSICLVAVIAVMAITGASLAYFTDKEEAENVFVVGKVDIELTEESWEAPEAAMPGVEYAKDPVVTNVGNNDAWIRVDVILSDAAAFMAAAEAHNITDLSAIFAGHDETKWTRANIALDQTADTLTYSYYYNEILAVGDYTEALFTSVTIPAAFNNAQMTAIGENFTINVVAHAIQTADAYDTVADAFSAYIPE